MGRIESLHPGVAHSTTANHHRYEPSHMLRVPHLRGRQRVELEQLDHVGSLKVLDVVVGLPSSHRGVEQTSAPDRRREQALYEVAWVGLATNSHYPRVVRHSAASWTPELTRTSFHSLWQVMGCS